METEQKSYNIQELKNLAKQKVIREIFFLKIDICMLQETKLQLMDETLVKTIRGFNNVVWSAKKASRMSGGLLILWNSNLGSSV